MALPGWLVARSGLRLSLEGNWRDFDESVRLPVTPGTSAVLTWCRPDEERIVWLTEGDLAGWGVALDDAIHIARQNLDGLLAQAEILPHEIAGHAVGVLISNSLFKSSLLLAPSLKDAVEPVLGWPARAIAPCRDFTLLLEGSGDDLIDTLATMVGSEFERDPNHALTMELLMVTSGGVEALGTFAEEDDDYDD